jgi:hypothetical protein
MKAYSKKKVFLAYLLTYFLLFAFWGLNKSFRNDLLNTDNKE